MCECDLTFNDYSSIQCYLAIFAFTATEREPAREEGENNVNLPVLSWLLERSDYMQLKELMAQDRASWCR